MIRRINYNLVLLMIIVAGSCINAEAETVGGAAAPYLRSGVNARYLAMGNAGTASIDDSSAVYWNPAVISRLARPELDAQTAVLGLSQSKQYIGFVYPVHDEAQSDYGFGLAWNSYSAGDDLEKRDSSRSEPMSLFEDHQSAVMISLANNFNLPVYFGITGKILSHELEDDTANGFGLDLAAWQQVSSAFQWGAVIQDCFSSLSWPSGYEETIPTLFRLGVVWKHQNQPLMLTADGHLLVDYRDDAVQQIGVHLGAEYWVYPFIAARMGLNTDQLTAGVGWQFSLSRLLDAKVDYAFAWERVESLGHTHLLSVNITLKSGDKEEIVDDTDD